MNRETLLYKAPRRKRIAALTAVALSVFMLMGSAVAFAADSVDVIVEHYYYDNTIGDYVLGEKKLEKLPAGVYVMDKLKEQLATQGSDVKWEFIPDDDGESTIKLEVGFEYKVEIYYSRLYDVTVELNGGNGSPSGAGKNEAGKTVPVEPPPTQPPVDPPGPNTPRGSIVSDGDGWLEIGEDGVPLGRWNWDEEEQKWIFDEFPPLSDVPRAGYQEDLMTLGAIIIFALGFGILIELAYLRRMAKNM